MTEPSKQEQKKRINIFEIANYINVTVVMT